MDQVKPGMRIAVAGKLEFNYGFKRMTNPYLEVLDGEGAAEGMIIPVHPACEKISAAWMRRLVGNALEAVCGLHDPLPLELRAKYRLMSRGAALSCIHFPHAMDEVAEARRRLVYEELLLLELMLMRESRERTDGCEPVVHAVDGPRMAALAEAVPFRLTDEQMCIRDRPQLRPAAVVRAGCRGVRRGRTHGGGEHVGILLRLQGDVPRAGAAGRVLPRRRALHGGHRRARARQRRARHRESLSPYVRGGL